MANGYTNPFTPALRTAQFQGPQPAAQMPMVQSLPMVMPSVIVVPGLQPSTDDIRAGRAAPSRSGQTPVVIQRAQAQTAPARSNSQVVQQSRTQTRPSGIVTRATQPLARNGTATAPAAVQRQVNTRANTPQVTKPPPRTAVVNGNGNGNGKGDSDMAQFGNIVRMDEAFGVGMRNPVGKPIFARGGGIVGPLTITKSFTLTQNDATVNAISITTTLTANDQALTGSERYIYQLSLSASTTGAGIPAGFTSQSLTDAILSGSNVILLVGSVPQAYYSEQQLLDTRFVQRGLDVEIYPDPGNFQSTAFQFSNPTAFGTGNFPLAAMGLTYTFTASLVTYWSLPGSVKL